MEEIWKTIKDYEKYEISNYGNVRTHYNKNNVKILKPYIDVWGYKRVDLVKDKKAKHFKIHRLVAETYIPNEFNYPIINHKDENKLNNYVDNLEWCTHAYNSTYKNARKNVEQAHYKPVNKLSIDGKFIEQYDSVSQAHKNTGINETSIICVCKNKQKTAGGYRWEYANK